MVLVGDAACFVDPGFSSGVHLATYGALLAARSINSVLAQAVDEDTAFREFEERYRREYGVFYEFLVSFYDLHVDEDSVLLVRQEGNRQHHLGSGVVRQPGWRSVLRRGGPCDGTAGTALQEPGQRVRGGVGPSSSRTKSRAWCR